MTVITSKAKGLRLKAEHWMAGKSPALTILPRITQITRIRSTMTLQDFIRGIREIRGPNLFECLILAQCHVAVERMNYEL
jgi:hypothetical protein